MNYRCVYIICVSIEYYCAKFCIYTAEERDFYKPEVETELLGSYIHFLPNDIIFYPSWNLTYDNYNSGSRSVIRELQHDEK